MGFKSRLVGFLERMALVEVELMVVALAQHFAQRAVGRKRDMVEQGRQPKLMGFRWLGVQDGLGWGRNQKMFGG